jgi:hypothetical protein
MVITEPLFNKKVSRTEIHEILDDVQRNKNVISFMKMFLYQSTRHATRMKKIERKYHNLARAIGIE